MSLATDWKRGGEERRRREERSDRAKGGRGDEADAPRTA